MMKVLQPMINGATKPVVLLAKLVRGPGGL